MRPREDTWIEAKARPRRHTRPPLVEQNAPQRGGSRRQAEACARCTLHLSHTSVKENLRFAASDFTSVETLFSCMSLSACRAIRALSFTRSVARSNTHTGRQHIGFSLASRTESLCSDLKAGEGPASSVWCTDGWGYWQTLQPTVNRITWQPHTVPCFPV